MKLYHWTKKENLESILQNGLSPSGLGIVYLTPSPDKVKGLLKGDEICLEVETGKNKLTAFEECKEWEVLCWGKIVPDKIKTLAPLTQL